MADIQSDRLVPHSNLRGLLQDLVGQLDKRILDAIVGTRFESVRPSDLRIGIMAYRQPQSMSAIARALGISRQAVHSSVKRLIELDVVEVSSETGKGRDKIIRVTDAGLQAQHTYLTIVRQLEQECADILGPKGLEQFRTQLLALVAALTARDRI